MTQILHGHYVLDQPHSRIAACTWSIRARHESAPVTPSVMPVGWTTGLELLSDCSTAIKKNGFWSISILLML